MGGSGGALEVLAGALVHVVRCGGRRRGEGREEVHGQCSYSAMYSRGRRSTWWRPRPLVA